MARARWIAALLTLTMAGCALQKMAPPPPAPPPVIMPAPPPMPMPAPPPPAPERGPSTESLLPTRWFARYRQQLAANYAAAAVILFRNADAGTPRLRAACAAYVRVLDETGPASEMVPPQAQMVMIWPVTEVTPALRYGVDGHDPATVDRACPDATARYDFSRMSPLRAQLAVRNANLRSGRGPWIVAWAPGQRYADNRAAFVVMDLSRFEDGELAAAFEAWSNRVQADRNIYEGDWNRQRFPELAAWWINRFGAKALDAFKLVAATMG